MIDATTPAALNVFAHEFSQLDELALGLHLGALLAEA